VKRAGFLLVPGGGCGKFPALVDIKSEIAKRRTFAIISHPDAGKTTLTEKLLLYGGAVQLAGSVTARKTSGFDVGLDGAGTQARDFDQLDGVAI